MNVKEKQIAIINNIINTALGITKVLQDDSESEESRILMASAVAKLGEYHTYLIQSQIDVSRFAAGGIVKRNNGLEPALIGSGEYVMPVTELEKLVCRPPGYDKNGESHCLFNCGHL